MLDLYSLVSCVAFPVSFLGYRNIGSHRFRKLDSLGRLFMHPVCTPVASLVARALPIHSVGT